MPGVCSCSELTCNPPRELLPLSHQSIFSPSSHTSSSAQPLISFCFLTLSAVIFSCVCFLPFHVCFFSLLHLCTSQVHLCTPPPSCKVPHVMPSLWLMWPLQLCDLASSAFRSFILCIFRFDLSTYDDTFFHPFSWVSSWILPRAAFPSLIFFTFQQGTAEQLSPVALQVTQHPSAPRAITAHAEVCTDQRGSESPALHQAAPHGSRNQLHCRAWAGSGGGGAEPLRIPATLGDLAWQGGQGEAQRSGWREGRWEGRQGASCRAGLWGTGGEWWWAEGPALKGQRRGHQSAPQGAEKKAALVSPTLCLRLYIWKWLGSELSFILSLSYSSPVTRFISVPALDISLSGGCCLFWVGLWAGVTHVFKLLSASVWCSAFLFCHTASRSPPFLPLPPPAPRGGDRRSCNLVPFARLEQHLPPSLGTGGSHPKLCKEPKMNLKPTCK